MSVNPEERDWLCRSFFETNYHVLTATCAPDALELCRKYEGAIHLLITSTEMPGASGVELAQAAKQLRPGLVVLFLSDPAAFESMNASLPASERLAAWAQLARRRN